MITSHFFCYVELVAHVKRAVPLLCVYWRNMQRRGTASFLFKDCFGKFRQLGHDIVARFGVDPVARHRVDRLPDSIGQD